MGYYFSCIQRGTNRIHTSWIIQYRVFLLLRNWKEQNEYSMTDLAECRNWEPGAPAAEEEKASQPQNMSICELLINLGSYDKAANRSFQQLRHRMTSRYLPPPPIHAQHNSLNKIPLMQLRYSLELPALQHLHHISIWMSTSEMATEQSIHWHRTKELIHNKHISRWSHASWPVLYFFWSFGH